LRKSRNLKIWIHHLAYSFLSLAIADLGYSIDFYLLGYIFRNTPFILIHQLPYILGMGFLAISTCQRSLEDLKEREKKSIALIIALLGVGYFALSYYFVLSYRFPAQYIRPTLNYFISYSYALLQSIAFGGLIVSSFRALELTEFALYFFFLTMMGSDFALRYQDVGGRDLGTPIFEYGWEYAIVGLSTALIAFKLKRMQEWKQPAPLLSFRVAVPVFSLLVLSLFVLGNFCLSNYLQVATVSTVGSQTIWFVSVWLGLNSVAIRFSRTFANKVHQLSHQLENTASVEKIDGFTSTMVELDPIVNALRRLKINLHTSQEEISKMKSQIAVSQVVTQVAHDIRSPLAALEMVAQCLPELSEKKRVLVRSAVGRITDIANDLLNTDQSQASKHPQPDQSLSIESNQKTVLLSTLVDSILTEKRIQYRSRIGLEIESELSSENYGLFVRIDPKLLRRVLSNLINNSVEAIDGAGKIKIHIKSVESNWVSITIEDTGKGMPDSVLTRLGERGFTFGKTQGTGRGLFHAKEVLIQFGGKLEIQSKEECETQITLSLPRAESPNWFLNELQIEPKAKIVVIDDDPTIHQVWQSRFHPDEDSKCQIELHHFTSLIELHHLIKSDSSHSFSLFLVDHEFTNSSESGLEAIQALNITSKSILVTSRFEDSEVVSIAEQTGIKIIPKGLAGFIPINKLDRTSCKTAVLLDNDVLIRET
jgi:signal transduction histidine kinase